MRDAPLSAGVKTGSSFHVPRSSSGLNPRQSRRPPASHRVAVTVLVAVAFKAFEHVVGVCIAGPCGGERRVVRAAAAAADEEDGVLLSHLALEVGDERRIRTPARI